MDTASCSRRIDPLDPSSAALFFSLTLSLTHTLVYMPVFSVTQASFRFCCLIVFNGDVVELSR